MFRPFVYLIENKYFNSSYGILIVLCVCSLCYSYTNHSCLQSVYKTRWQNCIRLFKIMEHKVVFHSPLMGLKAGFSLTFHKVSKKKLVIWLKFTSANEALLPSYREGNVWLFKCRGLSTWRELREGDFFLQCFSIVTEAKQAKDSGWD